MLAWEEGKEKRKRKFSLLFSFDYIYMRINTGGKTRTAA